MKKKLLSILSCCALFSYAQAQTVWEDKTSLIKNPSFEEGDAIADLTADNWNTSSVTDWTVLPETKPNYAQVGVGNSSSIIQGIGESFSSSEGDKYFYTRCNWNVDKTFSVSQTIDAANLPKGFYKLTCKFATFSSTPDKTIWTLSIQEGNNEAVTNTNIGSVAYWLNAGVVIYKESDETPLTISASMLPGAANSSQHYVMLVDDFQLHYVSEDNYGLITPDNVLDMSGVIYNAQIYNTNQTVLPCGWQEYGRSAGNSNITTSTGDTQLEGWRGNDGNTLSVDYYQTITGLPSGIYSLTARCHDSNNTGAYVYIYNATTGTRKTGDMENDYADVTTELLTVNQGESVNIGIKAEKVAATWCTGDDFRLTYYGTELNVKRVELRNLKKTATDDYLNNDAYANVAGTDRTELSSKISAEVGEETLEAYQNAINDLQAAINAFVANSKAYDLLGKEIKKATALGVDVKTAQDLYESDTRNAVAMTEATQNLKVDEYTTVTTTYPSAVDLGTWTATGPTGTMSSQHWDGTTSSTYLEQSTTAWGTSAWNIGYEQDLMLPAGKYVFKVAGRKAAGDGCTLKLVVTDNDASVVLGEVNDFPEGDTGLGINTAGATSYDTADEFANNGAGRGWEWRYVAFELQQRTSVNVAVTASATTMYQWVGFCNATIQTADEGTNDLITATIRLQEAIKVAGGMNVTANVGDGVFQIPTAKAEEMEKGLNDAQAVYDKEESTTEEINETAANLEVLNEEYNNVELNKPAEGQKFYLINNTASDFDWKGCAVTCGPGNVGAGEFSMSYQYAPDACFTQAFTLTATENTNEYTLSFFGHDGKTHYVCVGTIYKDGNNDQLRTTEDAANALYVRIEPTTTDGIYKLRNTKANKFIGANSKTDRGFFTTNYRSDFSIAEAKQAEVPVTIAAGKYATRIFPFVPNFGEGADVKVYSCEDLGENNNELNLVEVTDLEANMPYILYSEGGYENTLSDWGVAYADKCESGLLVGRFVAEEITSGYVLQTHENDKQAFYKVDNEPITIPQYRVYIELPEEEAAGVNALSLVLPDSEVTAVEGVVADDAVVDVYSINGILVRKAVKASDALRGLQSGLYIVNGVKRAVK